MQHWYVRERELDLENMTLRERLKTLTKTFEAEREELDQMSRAMTPKKVIEENVRSEIESLKEGFQDVESRLKHRHGMLRDAIERYRRHAKLRDEALQNVKGLIGERTIGKLLVASSKKS